MIVCLSVKRIVLEPTYEDFQEQVYEDFKMKYTWTPIFSFQSNEISFLEHITPIYFFIYSVVVVLHACVYEYAPMIGLTRIVLSFLEALA
jgi:hypothetical protein